MRPTRRHLALFRRFCLAVSVGGLLWLVWRFDLVSLPAAGNSPLVEIPPGARLLVDRHPRPFEVGDVLFFRGTDGALLMGRVVEPPPGLTAEAELALEAGAWWIEGDTPSLPLVDSRLLGPIPPERIEGRMLLFLDP